MNTLAKAFKKFSDQVMPEHASEVQKAKMKLAFYAGAKSILTMQKQEINVFEVKTEYLDYITKSDVEDCFSLMTPVSIECDKYFYDGYLTNRSLLDDNQN
jgi:hypothetical protein